MSKSTTGDPYILGPDSPTQRESVKAIVQTKSVGDPYILTGDAKKKDGGENSGIGSTNQGNALSTSQSQLPSATAQKWNDKDASAKDVQAVAKTDAGKQLGIDDLKTKDQREQYADAHNMGTMNDVFTKVKSLTDTWSTTLKQNNPAPLQAQLKNQDAGTQIDNLVQGVKTGDPDAIYSFKDKVKEGIKSQIDAIEKNPQGPLQGIPGGGMGYGGQDYKDLSNDQKKTIADLKKQSDSVDDTYKQYAELSLVNQAEKMPGGVHNSTNAMWVGRNLRRLSEPVRDFKAQQNLRTNEDSDAITERNYLDEKNGLAAIINQRGMLAAQDAMNAVQSKGPQDGANVRKLEVNELTNRYKQLSNKYFPVQVYNTAKTIGDVLSGDNAVPRGTLNMFYSPTNVADAVSKLQKENPEFIKTNAASVQFLMAHPNEIPMPGVLGGIERGVSGAVENGLHWLLPSSSRLKNETANEIRDQFDAAKQGTSFSGKIDTKTVVDQNGKAFKELPNENYSHFNYNTAMNGIGEFAGNTAVYALLTEGSGAILGGTVEAGANIAKASRLAEAVSAGSKARQIAGITASTYMMNYENNAKIANTLIDDNSEHGDVKRTILTNLMTIGQAASMQILPANVFIRNQFMREVGADGLSILAADNAQGLTRPVVNQFLNNVKDRAVSLGQDVLKQNAEMLLINHSNALLESMFDETGATKKNDVLQEDINTVRDVTLGSLVLGGLGAIKSSFGNPQRDAIYDVALHADDNIQRIRDMQDQGIMDREKGNYLIKVIKTAEYHLPSVLESKAGNEAEPDAEGAGLPLTLRQRKAMLAEKLRSSMIADRLQDDPNDPELKKAQVSAEKAFVFVKNEIPYLPIQPETKGNETDQTKSPEAAASEENNSPQTQATESAKVGDQKIADENTISVKEMLDKKGTYNGQEGQFYQDGQTVVFKVDGGKKEYELGNVNDIGEHSIKEYGIEQQQSVVAADEKGNLTVRGEKYTNPFEERGQSPLDAVTYDKDGNVVNVRLKTEDGERRTFRGNVAEDLAYQIHLKEIDKNNEQRQVEDFINEDPESREAIDNAGSSETPEGGRGENTEQVQRTKIKRRVISSQPKIEIDESEKRNGEAPQKGTQTDQGRQGGEGWSQSQEENGNAGRTAGQEQSVLTEKGAADAGPEEVAPSQLAQETKENHLDAIRNIEKREDRISAKDIENPGQVKKPILKNIAAKELGKEKLSESEQKIADARRADIDDIKINNEAKRFDKRMSDEDRSKRDVLNDKVALIDKYGIDDIVKKMIDNNQIEKICG